MALTPEDIAAVKDAVFDELSAMMLDIEENGHFYTEDNGATPDRDIVELVFGRLRNAIAERKQPPSR